MKHNIATRLVLIRDQLKLNQKDMAHSIGVALRTWQGIERGENIPSGETLLKIAELGFNPGWILTGDGPIRLGEQVKPIEVDTTIDPDLFRAVLKLMARIYREEDIRLPAEAAAEEAVGWYNEVSKRGEDRDERLAQLGWLEIRIRKRLSEAKAEPGAGKRSA